MKPAVIITVSGGIADYLVSGDVDVVVVDYDAIEVGDDDPAVSRNMLSILHGDKEFEADKTDIISNLDEMIDLESRI